LKRKIRQADVLFRLSADDNLDSYDLQILGERSQKVRRWACDVGWPSGHRLVANDIPVVFDDFWDVMLLACSTSINPGSTGRYRIAHE
jgi:hypothetical protein